MDRNRIDFKESLGRHLPGTPSIRGHPKTLRGSREEGAGTGRMLHYVPGPSRGRWDSLDLSPYLATIQRFIDSATCGRDDMVGIGYVDIYREHIRVINHPVLDQPPIRSSVIGLVSTPPGSRIDDFRVSRVYGDRVDGRNLDVDDFPPTLPPILTFEDTIHCPYHNDARVEARLSHRMYGFSLQLRRFLPRDPTVYGLEKPARLLMPVS